MERVAAFVIALMLAWIVLIWFPGLIVPQPSLRDIGSPCRGHGGVAQYLPATTSLVGDEPATVVCRDGKVGRV